MMPTAILRSFAITIFVVCGVATRAAAQSDGGPVEAIISVSDQKMIVVREGGWLRKYKVSTSRFGTGDSYGSYRTPLGRLRVWEKLGGELASGAVIKHREATGEILPVNAPGRDPIVSRILWLEGLEPQNDHARGRGIYIHGTTEESNIGKPVSWGCIRMRSEEVMEFYDLVPVGTFVTIMAESLPYFPKWKPAPPVVIASQPAPPPTVKLPANPVAKLIRSLPEQLPRVAEMLRPPEERMAPADVSAANAFHGSILFAGISATAKPASKTVRKTVPVLERPRAAELPAPVTPPFFDEAFSLRVTPAVPPLALIDLRRVALSPLTGAASIFDTAVPPTLAILGESDRDFAVSAPIFSRRPLF